jgi:hypothetical protein
VRFAVGGYRAVPLDHVHHGAPGSFETAAFCTLWQPRGGCVLVCAVVCGARSTSRGVFCNTIAQDVCFLIALRLFLELDKEISATVVEMTTYESKI